MSEELQVCNMLQSDNPSVAIVDDEEDFVRLLTRLFQKRGIPVSFVAYDGSEAVQKYREATCKPNIILMDHHMKDMDGLETTRHIMSDNKDAKVIFISADAHVREDALKAGACAFLSKPTGINEIVNAIKNCEQ